MQKLIRKGIGETVGAVLRHHDFLVNPHKVYFTEISTKFQRLQRKFGFKETRKQLLMEQS